MSAFVRIPRRSPRSLHRSSYSSTSSSPPSSFDAPSSSYPRQALAYSLGDHGTYPNSMPPSPSAASLSLDEAHKKIIPESRLDGVAQVDKNKESEVGMSMERRPSLMGTSLRTSTHTVIDIGFASGVPRLISCVRSSQGFDWNQNIFLPSYAYAGIDGSSRGRSDEEILERAREDVAEIRLDDINGAGGLLPE